MQGEIFESPDGDPAKRGELGDEVPLVSGWQHSSGREARPRKATARLLVAASIPEALAKARES